MKKIEYYIGKILFSIVISVLGMIRKHVDNTTQQKIDDMICSSIIKNTKR
ncbi:MAG: hypothetical protein ACLU7E_07465 [Clostridium butyricum]